MKFEKIAPGLSILMADYEKHGRRGLARHTKTMGIISSIENSPKPPRVVSFLYCDTHAEFTDLKQNNIIVNQPFGKIRTVLFPLDNLDFFSDDDRVKRIIPAHYLKLKMDVASTRINVPMFRNINGLSGNGVIIGIVDTGIDPNHPSFSNRILKTWDQTLQGPGVQEGTYGVELGGGDRNMLSVSRDTEGHGTHVAGIAGGKEPKFGGIAPDADYIIVKSDLMDAHIADGVRYIFRVASDLSRPAVINLSLGGHSDAHDGTDPLSEIINSESGPGKIVCCAAGNEGNDNIHAQAKVMADSIKEIRFIVTPPPPPSSFFGANSSRWVGLNGWYSGSDKMQVSVRSPSGFSTPFQSIVSNGNNSTAYDIADGKITISTPPSDPSNNDHNFFIVLDPHGASTSPLSGTWKLQLRGETIINGLVDIWILDDSSGSQTSVFTGTSVNSSMKIGSPGCSSQAITVASFTTKNHWIDIDQKKRSISMLENTISDFSSDGPLRNGNQKPDITAPGAFICSELSADSQLEREFMISSKLRMMAGTSMATPVITGIVCLLLQRNKNLDANAIRDILKHNGHIPNKPNNTFDNKWGYGVIDMSIA